MKIQGTSRQAMGNGGPGDGGMVNLSTRVRPSQVSEIPEGFEYPKDFLAIMTLGVLYNPLWNLLEGENLEEKHLGLRERYPSRRLIPIAQSQRSDDVVCFEVGEKGILTIHDYTFNGWENRSQYPSVADWFLQVYSVNEIAGGKTTREVCYQSLLEAIKNDARYKKNLPWGKPRRGHPEGSILRHIELLEKNLRLLEATLSSEEQWKLLILTHVHDTFKPDADKRVPISSPKSHASLARAFLADYTTQEDLLVITQEHDRFYSLYQLSKKEPGRASTYFDELLLHVANQDLLVAFFLIDSVLEGKSSEPVSWALNELEQRGVLPPRAREWLQLLQR